MEYLATMAGFNTTQWWLEIVAYFFGGHPVGHMISLNLSDDDVVSLRSQSLIGQSLICFM